ncbi:hypothetical protein UPYG_G00324450 [Umbra pygmaea]|uniref:Protein FAM53B n=1 Tax=Umbra pygmaea TaxID=75934 RepID=A0ABD0W110_UMBPY
MVIIFTKTLEKQKGVNYVQSTNTENVLQQELHTMNTATALPCRPVEADRWLDLGRGCAIHAGCLCTCGPSLQGLWDILPEEYQRKSRAWDREVGTSTAITSLIQDLNLSEVTQSPNSTASMAPPSKRQCRLLSLSFSEDFEGCRSLWRPQGSHVWRAVEKRRCLSGGSMPRFSGGDVIGADVFSRGIPALQRSSSLRLPSVSNNPTDGTLELPRFTQHMPLYHQFFAFSPSPSLSLQHLHSLRPLSLSHEQISLPENHRKEASSPDTTPELGGFPGQRTGGTGGLSRSKSQPCVLNDKKIGMKRRRQEDAQEPRPSLDLAKMTQKRQTFHSLSCPGFSGLERCQSNTPPLFSRSHSESGFACATDSGTETQQEADEEGSSCEVQDSDSVYSLNSRPGSPYLKGMERTGEGHCIWKGERVIEKDVLQLGGELDIDQIERN